MTDLTHKITAHVRPIGQHGEYEKRIYASEHGDVQKHMDDLVCEGLEVLSVVSSPNWDISTGDDVVDGVNADVHEVPTWRGIEDDTPQRDVEETLRTDSTGNEERDGSMSS